MCERGAGWRGGSRGRPQFRGGSTGRRDEIAAGRGEPTCERGGVGGVTAGWWAGEISVAGRRGGAMCGSAGAVEQRVGDPRREWQNRSLWTPTVQS
jgi:hypothetical protein